MEVLNTTISSTSRYKALKRIRIANRIFEETYIILRSVPVDDVRNIVIAKFCANRILNMLRIK